MSEKPEEKRPEPSEELSDEERLRRHLGRAFGKMMADKKPSYPVDGRKKAEEKEREKQE